MQVTAILESEISRMARWRISGLRRRDRGGIPRRLSPSIAAAVAAGTERLVSLNVVDRSDSAARPWARPRQGGDENGSNEGEPVMSFATFVGVK